MQLLACGHSAEKNKSGNIGAEVTEALGPKGMQPGQHFGITSKVKNTPICQLWKCMPAFNPSMREKERDQTKQLQNTNAMTCLFPTESIRKNP